jgi:hypothetical protein
MRSKKGKNIMIKKTIIIFEQCLDCPYCSEERNNDRCFSELLEEDTKKIDDVYSIPNWCPLEDV